MFGILFGLGKALISDISFGPGGSCGGTRADGSTGNLGPNGLVVGSKEVVHPD
jgi:hypothetical protein